MTIPRPEHPQPQLVRPDWLNLNGQWDFSIDAGNSGRERRFFADHQYEQKITVPFCPESALSGVHHQDFMPAVWYRRQFQITEAQAAQTTLLHFGAVDYACEVWVNGQSVGTHRGGYASFSFDISAAVKLGENTVVVWAQDEVRTPGQPHGKQSTTYASRDVFYSRVTGIWQTVWLEFLPQTHIVNVQYYPNLAGQSIGVQVQLKGTASLTVDVSYAGQSCGTATVQGQTGVVTLNVPLTALHLWEVGHGRLYDITLHYGDDQATSYFGMRDIQIKGNQFLLNGQPVFQRLVLDQGYNPQGIYTAPTDQFLADDIQLALKAGFNGARLHQKVFEPRFLYHCDQAGFIVWGEYGNWGTDVDDASALSHVLPEWLEVVQRDFNHPSIITWCPFNETLQNRDRPTGDILLQTIYALTKQADPTRPCIDTSGFTHTVTDIYDIHDYIGDGDKLAEKYGTLAQGVLPDVRQINGQGDATKPVLLSEYGGIRWSPDDSGWGYGDQPHSVADFIARYRGITNALLNNPQMCGFCYTQLYDVEQEKNGLYTYDRQPKFDLPMIKAITSAPAGYEGAPL